jgi:hypothetical protein
MKAKSPADVPEVSLRPDRALASLGITQAEEDVYRRLLPLTGAHAGWLASSLDLDEAPLRSILQSLERKGLATRSTEATPRFFAVPPDIAIEALIADRQSELYRARGIVPELRDAARPASVARLEDMNSVEVLTHEAVGKVFPQIMRSAQDEILAFERLPMLVWDAMPNEAELQCLARGVSIRIIADAGMLHVPRHVERLRSAVQAGEVYRVFSGLPMKMIIVDRSVAIIPINTMSPGSPHLLLRSSSLLEAMRGMFDLIWRVAAPFSASGGDESDDEGDSDAILSLLAAGLADKAIEQELKISRRTLTRRVLELMKQHGAATRFQLGWLAGRAPASGSAPTS